MNTLVIDPGIHGCGAAYGVDKTLKAVAYIRGRSETKIDRWILWRQMALNVDTWAPALKAEELVIELPMVYLASHQRGTKTSVNPDDIVELATCVGTIIGTSRCSRVKIYRPYEWKGQVPKEICHARAIKALTASERAVIDTGISNVPKSLQHNALDAVAMFLKHVGRVK